MRLQYEDMRISYKTGDRTAIASCVLTPTFNFSIVWMTLDLYETGMLPWDIEMMVEDPLSDDEDGVPHCVSDSESESENDSD
jgi:hypothetical protein